MKFLKIKDIAIASSLVAGNLMLLASNVHARPVLIYDYQVGGDEAVGLNQRHVALGNTVTTIDLSYGAHSSYAPTGLSTYSQVWDLGANVALTAGQVAAYTSYLQGGGALFVMGETAFGANRNASIVSFISNLGGGQISIADNNSSLSNVASQFRIVNTNTSVRLNGSSRFPLSGSGTCITSDCSAVAWGVGTLSNAALGTVVSVLDVNFMTTYGFVNNNYPGARDFTDNLIGYFAQQSDISQLIASGGQVNLDTSATSLRSVFNMQSAALNAGLSYDCEVFDGEGLCLSAGGRYSSTSAPESKMTSGLIIGARKFGKFIKMGGWVDQNLSTNTVGNVNLSNTKPMFGFFGSWAERTDGLGYDVKVSSGFGDKDIEVARTAANHGAAKISTKGIKVVGSYGISVFKNLVAAPYLGLKYQSVKRGAYSETGSNSMTYNALRQKSKTLLAGVNFIGDINPQVSTVFTAGVEKDFDGGVDQYIGYNNNFSAVTTSFDLNIQKTRPVVSLGVFYDVNKSQRFGLSATYRQEAFESTATTSLTATYTFGL